MSKHTPGPWKFVPHMKDHRIFAVKKTKYHRTKTICDLYDNPQRPQEFEANARLIAAAPELLYACKEALAGYLVIQSTFDRPEDVQPMIDTLRQVITKAEGGK